MNGAIHNIGFGAKWGNGGPQRPECGLLGGRHVVDTAIRLNLSRVGMWDEHTTISRPRTRGMRTSDDDDDNDDDG